MAPNPHFPDRHSGARTAAAAPNSGAGTARDDAAAVEWLKRCCGEFPEGFGPLALLLAVSVLVRLPVTSPLRTRLAVWLECVLLHACMRRSGDVAALRQRVEAHRRAALGRDRAAAEIATGRTVDSARALLAHGPLFARVSTLEGLAAGLEKCLVAHTPDCRVIEVLPPGSADADEDDADQKSGGGPILSPAPSSMLRPR